MNYRINTGTIPVSGHQKRFDRVILRGHTSWPVLSGSWLIVRPSRGGGLDRENPRMSLFYNERCVIQEHPDTYPGYTILYLPITHFPVLPNPRPAPVLTLCVH
jgi:hypothetical protein